MSMLAERKRKQKWSLNPRGNVWAQDTNKFGQKLLEKMGWKEGKGLGAKEDGMVEHVKVSYKNDSEGFGFKDKDGWTEHDDNFSSLLQKLSNNDNAIKINTKSEEEIKPKSLEIRSQSSKKRVHYYKFTRGKDLSRYSEKDLANIFGKKSLRQKSPEKKVENKEKNKNFVGGGSMIDYFKSKMTSNHNKFTSCNEEIQNNVDSWDTIEKVGLGFEKDNSFSFQSENESLTCSNWDIEEIDYEKDKKSKKRKSTEEFEPNSSGKINNEDINRTPKKKKKKNNNDDVICGLSNPAFDPLSVKEIPIERHSLNTIEEVDEIEEILPSVSLKEKVKKKKKTDSSEFSETVVENNMKKKKKKDKTEPDDLPNINLKPLHSSTETFITNNNILEVKVKSKNKKNKNKNKGVENFTFNENFLEKDHDIKSSNFIFEEVDFEESQINPEQSVKPSNPYEVKVKRKKRKITSGIENPSLNFSNSTESLKSPLNSTYEVVVPSKSKKGKKNEGIENPSLNLSDSIDNCQNSKSTNKSTNNSDCVLNVSDEPDMMLNTSIGPPEYLKQSFSGFDEKSSTSSVSNKKRKSVRFSELNQEREIPNRFDQENKQEELSEINIMAEGNSERDNLMKEMVKEGLINKGFDFRKDRIDNKIQMISERFETLKTVVENDINETKDLNENRNLQETKIISIGEPVTEGENEKLEEGTKLRLKYAEFGRTPYWMRKYKSDLHPKKSYKHLIKGDIILEFKNTNLHEIDGYGKKKKS